MPAKEMENLREIFEALDLNGDGKLSKDEIQEAYSKCKSLKHVSIKKVLKDCDLNKSGYVNYTEFLAATADWRKLATKERLQIVFKSYDLDGNGSISVREFKELLGCADIEDDDIRYTLTTFDKNNDGEIDFPEFLSLMKSS
jgi:calcium-dependent protein kinase